MPRDDPGWPPPEGTRWGEFLAADDVFEVWSARPCSSRQSPLVVKVLAASFAGDPAIARALEADLRRVEHHDHPNLFRVASIHSSEGRLSMVLPWVPGISLAILLDYLRRHARRLSPRLSLRVALHLLAALTEYHRLFRGEAAPDGAADGVHRKVIPSNVQIAANAQIVLGEPGFERRRLGRTPQGLAAVRARLPYMSPEEVCGEPLSPASDGVAIGRILYEMLTGRPFLRAESDAMLRRLAEKPPPFAAAEHPQLSACLQDVLARALAPSPDDRFASSARFAVALERAARTIRGPGRPEDLADLVQEVMGHDSVRAEPGSARDLGGTRSQVASTVVDRAFGGLFQVTGPPRPVGAQASGAQDAPEGSPSRFARRGLSARLGRWLVVSVALLLAVGAMIWGLR